MGLKFCRTLKPVPVKKIIAQERTVRSSIQKRATRREVLTHDWFVVRREGLRATHGRLDARRLQGGYPVDGTGDVSTEHIPVQLVQSEGEVPVQLSGRSMRAVLLLDIICCKMLYRK